MDVVMDGLLIAGTLFAGIYCWVLAGRVQALKSLDSGLGGAIVTLTRQIELARATLDEARAGSRETRQDLGQLVARAEAAGAQLRLLLAVAEKAEGRAAPHPAPLAAPAPGTSVPPRREAAGPRLVQPPDAGSDAGSDPPAESFAADASETGLPKPRRMPSLDGLLRRHAAPGPAAAPRSEQELIAALTALAAGGER